MLVYVGTWYMHHPECSNALLRNIPSNVDVALFGRVG